MTTITTPSRPVSASPLDNFIIRRPVLTYFALAFAGSWLVLLPLALGRGEHGLGLLPIAVPSGPDFLLAMLSAYTGPFLAAILVTRATGGWEGVRQLRHSITRWRIAPRWYLVALLTVPAVWFVAYSVVLENGALVELARQPMLLLTSFLPAVLIGLFLPSLGEETGWRGVALPRLQQRHGPLLATLLLGLLHAIWHLPMFFTPNLGPFTPTTFTTSVLSIVAVAFVYTWVFNNSGGSVLLAILLHASGNAASGLLNRLLPGQLPLSGWVRTLEEGGWISAIAFGLVALVLVIVTRGRLGYRRVA